MNMGSRYWNERAFNVLKTCGNESLSLYEIHKRTQYHISTLYKLLSLLEKEGLMESEFRSIKLKTGSGRRRLTDNPACKHVKLWLTSTKGSKVVKVWKELKFLLGGKNISVST